MDNRVAMLQTQRDELLATYVTVRDRDTAQHLLKQLKNLSEELELVAAAATPLIQASTLSGDFYASSLLLLLLSKDLNDARFLWKRIEIEIKETSEELQKVWEIGKALWHRNLAAAYVAMDYNWSPMLQGLVEALKILTREATAELLSVAYSTISIADVALALGFARQEDALQYCSSLNWNVSEAEQLVWPKPMASVQRGPSTTVDLDQLDMLSKTVLHLEQNTVVKLP
ncbi:unnamed protein product [Peronospora farinosa]|uniref:COP9 signalosome complex subunit 8 n=1 Tax=Peronospora farinosa TaxID=134698 RepID=A0AAV0TU71_9STRA|nr:unnamed protein product [Peronospora farinosa]CAI5726806.1 unnamed protein product [Peronospora farinosa]